MATSENGLEKTPWSMRPTRRVRSVTRWNVCDSTSVMWYAARASDEIWTCKVKRSAIGTDLLLGREASGRVAARAEHGADD